MSAIADSWALVPFGSQLPAHPVRVKGQQNMYVALWYCDGQPVVGRAWTNGGVVECSFPFMGRELTATADLGSEIHILTTGGPYAHYWYEWAALGDWRGLQRHLDVVRVGQATPVLLRSKDGTELLGNLDLATERASFGYRGTVEVISGEALQQALIICRNLRDTPPLQSMLDTWLDLRANDLFPVNAVQALYHKELKYGGGSGGERDKAQFVALWFKQGEPVMGRAVERFGRIYAYFGSGGMEYSADIGSLQLLVHPHVNADFAYCWRPLRTASADGWRPVQVGGVAPCVITDKSLRMQRLGQVKLSSGVASIDCDGAVSSYCGGAVQKFCVLCRTN